MTMTEAPYSRTVKVGADGQLARDGELLTVRGGSYDEFIENHASLFGIERTDRFFKGLKAGSAPAVEAVAEALDATIETEDWDAAPAAGVQTPSQEAAAVEAAPTEADPPKTQFETCKGCNKPRDRWVKPGTIKSGARQGQKYNGFYACNTQGCRGGR